MKINKLNISTSLGLSLILISLILIAYNAGYSQAAQTANELTGEWQIEFTHEDIGSARVAMQFEANDESYIARSRKNADRAILGRWKAFLARIFTDDFKDGSLLRIEQGTIDVTGDQLELDGTLISALGKYRLEGTVTGDSLHAIIQNSNQRQTGRLSGRRKPHAYPLDDYPAIVENALSVTTARIYDKTLLDTKDWKQFENNIREVSTNIQDDLELIFSFFHFAEKLPFSHFALTRFTQNSNINSEIPDIRNANLEEIDAQSAYLQIQSFNGRASEIDSLFSLINQNEYSQLIVDLRNNPGGTIEAGMAFAKYLVDQPRFAGAFLTQSYFNSNHELPTAEMMEEFESFSEENAQQLLERIHMKEGIALEVFPAKIPFSGEIYILTNKNTASTSEPIIYHLKQHNRAIIIGEKTAGAMLSSEQFILPGNFTLIVPTADYYTSDGYRIEKNGIEPDIAISPGEAYRYAIKHMIKKSDKSSLNLKDFKR